ncbi:hypothetical protein [Shewanella algae]|uniref:hypothetical protein n=1 Tax=Shewanella algae TaxID=38313 RepID=UPI00118367B0|nr:hypothetical protein [Shewanella algae]QGS59722.1 hypothetical protein GMX02_09450 [Shewanella algae]TVL33043.1 hypothetical protein AYI94_17975 [Shewanella algae]
MERLKAQFEENVLPHLKTLADDETCIIEIVDPIEIIKSNEVRFSLVLRINNDTGDGAGKCIARMTGTNGTTFEEVYDHFHTYFCLSFR